MRSMRDAVSRRQQRRFQRRDLMLERLELLARPQQYAALHVELLARDQIELAQAADQYAAQVGREVFAGFAHAGRYQIDQARSELIDGADDSHALHPVKGASAGFAGHEAAGTQTVTQVCACRLIP